MTLKQPKELGIELTKAGISQRLRTVHSNTCKNCKSEYLIKGLEGGIRELIFENTCPTCEDTLPTLVE